MYNTIPDKLELYNLRTDPGQQKDISEANPRLMRKLIPIMISQWISIRDEGKRNDKAYNVKK